MMAEAAPFPVLGSIAQSALDRIAVNVAQFLDELRTAVIAAERHKMALASVVKSS
jgi:hypothetical protein